VFNSSGQPGDTSCRRLSSAAVGDASDGWCDQELNHRARKKTAMFHLVAAAFVNRSHSGFFGIVNSEEGTKPDSFLFGDVRAMERWRSRS